MVTRIRLDKQAQKAPGAGYVPYSDSNGELQFALLSALTGNYGGGSTSGFIGDVHTVDSMALVGNALVLSYSDNQGQQFVKRCDLTTLAVDVKLDGAILLHPEANTYILQLKQSDGSTVAVNLSDLLAVVTVNSPDIILSGNGTAADPLTATLTDSVRALLGPVVAGTDWTDAFTGLTSGNTVRLTYRPIYPFPIYAYRNGVRAIEFVDWKYNPEDPMTVTALGEHFGTSGMAESFVMDYKTLEKTSPRVLK